MELLSDIQKVIGSNPIVITKGVNMKDEVNRKNITMFFAYIGLFFICVIIIMLVGVLAGSTMSSLPLGSLDRPVASYGYVDHRI